MKTVENSADNEVLKYYLNEISGYPVLSSTEEIDIFNRLQKIKNLQIIDEKEVNGIKLYLLKLDTIILSLSKSSDYEAILDLFIMHFKKSNKLKEIEYLKLFKSYKKYTLKLGRNLNDGEIYELFADLFNDQIVSTVDDLYNQANLYVNYCNAYNKIFNSNLKLVVSIAKRYKSNMELIDLINEGNIGLMKAIDRFDIHEGYKFSTYGTWWIKHMIQRSISNQKSLIRIPNSLLQDLIKFNYEISLLENKLKYKPTIAEIAKHLSLPIDKVNEYLENNFLFISLDQPINEEESSTLLDIVEDDYNLDNEMDSRQLRADVIEMLDSMKEHEILNERECIILKMRFGIGEYASEGMKKLQEIGDVFGITRERVRAIEKKALCKVRKTVRFNPQYKYIRNYIK